MSDTRKESLAVTGDDPRVRSDIAPVATERAFSWLRLLVMVSGTVVFFLDDDLLTIPWLVYGMFVVGWAYTLAVLWLEPYRRYPVLSSAWVTVTSDTFFTLTWIVATGGAESPWQPALFAPAVGASLRLRPRDTLFISLAAVGAYVSVITMLGQLPGREAETIQFAFYILFVATVCAVIARERQERLASRLALLDLVQEVAQVGSWEYTIPDRSIAWSREQRRIFELPDDVEPSFALFYAAIHPDDLDEVQRVAERVVTVGGEHRLEHRVVPPSGRVRWVECRMRLLRGEDGSPRQVVGTTQDITDAKKLQEQLLVGSKLASLGTLASGIAHEINNPLAYVATSLALARRRIDAGPIDAAGRTSLDSALNAAEDGTRRVASIVRGLKVFSRPGDDAAREVVALSAVADSALAMASHEVGQRARLVREYACDGLVLGSESRLLQVVLNLVVNAAHAVAGGSPDAQEIRVTIEPVAGGRVRLSIRDTGCGISSDHLPRLFEPFFTTKPPGVGTGLGLAICHRIVQDLGGEISVDSAVGRGSTFHVILPAAPEDAITAAPAPALAPASTPVPAPTRRLRVLVIDDEEIYARSLCTLLGIDHDVTFASGAGRALSLLCAGESFDVVLCDLMMAGISGMELHEALASVQPAIVPRIVFLTGGATNERARAFLERGDIRCLDKPVPLAMLRSTILEVTHPAP